MKEEEGGMIQPALHLSVDRLRELTPVSKSMALGSERALGYIPLWLQIGCVLCL